MSEAAAVVVAPAPAAAVVVPAEDDFDAQFETAAQEGAAGVVDAAVVETPATDVTKPAEKPVVETPVDKKEPPAAETPAAPVQSPADIALEALTKAQDQLAARTEAARVKKETDDAATKATKDASDALAARIAPHQPSEAETAAMAKFEKEFPSEYVAMQSRLKTQKQEMSAELYKAIADGMTQVEARLKPLEATVTAQNTVVQETAIERAIVAITAAHTDYEEIHPLLKPWIDKLPAYKRATVQAVYERGTAADVIDMVTDFKKDTGRTEAIPAAGTGAEPVKPKAKGASKEDIDSGAPVATLRTAPKPSGGEPDKNDYDGAFEEAAGDK